MKFSQYLYEGIRAADFEKAVGTIVQYLEKQVGTLYRYPQIEHYNGSQGQGVGLRYFLQDGTSLRFNWTSTSASSKLDSISLWDGSSRHPNFQIRGIGDVPLGQLSLAKILPTLAQVIKNPKVGEVELSTQESIEVLDALDKQLFESVLNEDAFDDVIGALEQGAVSGYTFAKMGRNQERIFKEILAAHKDQFETKVDGAGRQRYTFTGELDEISRDDIVGNVVGNQQKSGRLGLSVSAGGNESTTTDGEDAAAKQYPGAPARVPYEEQLDDMKTIINAVVKGASNFTVILGAGGLGKFLENDAVIFTKSGPTLTHGTVAVGDKILTPSGREATVLQTFPHNDVPLFRVTLADGTSVLAGGPHLWKVWDKTYHWCAETKKRIYKGAYRTLTTLELMDKGIQLRPKRVSSKGKEIPAESRFLIPFLPTPVEFNDVQLPIDPYTLGYLIGDGSISTPNIRVTIGSQDQAFAVNKLKGLLSDTGKLTYAPSSKCDFSFTNIPDIREGLTQLNLSGATSHTKFIPQLYLYAPFEDRLSLLQGLMDTDGCVEGSGNTYVYYSVSEQLAKDVQQLALSFGGFASIRSVDHAFTGLAASVLTEDRLCTCFRVTFSIPFDFLPVSNPRKIDMCSPNTRRNDVRGKAIVSIEYERNGDATCIMVDDPEHLYLTDNFITTHNTHTVEETLGELGLEDGNGYFKNTSSGSAAGLYKTLFMNRTGIVVLDDCDTIVATQEGRNLLKAALDTKKKRKLVWAKMGSWLFDPADEEEMAKAQDSIAVGEEPEMFPRYFDFEGRVIMISNLPAETLDPDGALATRGFIITLNPTKDEVFAFMRKIAPKIPVEGRQLTDAERNEVVDMIEKQPGSANIRKLVRGLNMAASGVQNWQRIVERYC